MTTRIAMLLAALALAGCAGVRPIVDMQGRSAYQYEADLADCQQYAAGVDVGGHALVGAALGAGLGAALGAVLGDAGTGAALGAISGGATGLGQGAGAQVDVVRRCLAGRGWNVLY